MPSLETGIIQECFQIPSDLTGLVDHTKMLFDQGVDTTNFGFLTIEQAALQTAQSIIDIEPADLYDTVMSQTRLSPASYIEILTLPNGECGQLISQVANVVAYELEALFPEVIQEEERRAEASRPTYFYKPGKPEPKAPWIPLVDREQLHKRINRDRLAMGFAEIEAL